LYYDAGPVWGVQLPLRKKRERVKNEVSYTCRVVDLRDSHTTGNGMDYVAEGKEINGDFGK